MDAQQQLRSMVADGLASDIFRAIESRHLFEAIGEHAERVNESSYRPTFAALQWYASDQFALAITRLLERQNRSYPLQSAHGVLEFLRLHASEITIQEPVFLMQSMQRLRTWFGTVESTSGAEQTAAAVEILAGRLPRHEENVALRSLRALRDKRIAHPERLSVESLPGTTFQDAETLLKIPMEVLAVCSAYLGIAYVDSYGAFMMDSDAKRPANATRRLLRDIGVAPRAARPEA
jgi:hypothetical protein